MTPDEWKEYELRFQPMLGRLIGNLVNFEVMLRVALYLIDTPVAERRSSAWKIADLNVGELLPVDHISSYDSLRKLINQYNNRSPGSNRQIDIGLVDLRDALAHGRITSVSHFSIPVLIRFAEPEKHADVVAVTERHVMTIEWMDSQVGRVHSAGAKVDARIKEELSRARVR